MSYRSFFWSTEGRVVCGYERTAAGWRFWDVCLVPSEHIYEYESDAARQYDAGVTRRMRMDAFSEGFLLEPKQ